MPDWSGSDTIFLNVTDLGNVGAGGALVATGQVQIYVSPINDAPEILLDPEGFGLLPNGGALGTNEDVPLPLELLAFEDKEMSAGGGGRLTVSFQCSNGGFVLASDDVSAGDEESATGVVWSVGGFAVDAGSAPWQTVVFSGGLAETNGVLDKLKYAPAQDWHGVDDLNVRFRRSNVASIKYPATETRCLDFLPYRGGRFLCASPAPRALDVPLMVVLSMHFYDRWKRAITGTTERVA